MELIDLYDAERRLTGQTAVRGTTLPKGTYRLVVHACIFNKKGEMLIQRRQSFKKNWPGLWDVSMGGGVLAGETSRMGAQRELWEELGLKHSFEEERPFLTVHFDEAIDSGFDDYYAFEWDGELSKLQLQYEEVSEVRWAGRAEVLALLSAGQFVSYYPGFMEALFDLWDKHSAYKE